MKPTDAEVTTEATNGTAWEIEDAEYMRKCAFPGDARIVRDLLIEKIEGTGEHAEVEMITSTVVSRHEDGAIDIVLGFQNSTRVPARRVKVSITRVDD
jgi:hypothetical protein